MIYYPQCKVYSIMQYQFIFILKNEAKYWLLLRHSVFKLGGGVLPDELSLRYIIGVTGSRNWTRFLLIKLTFRAQMPPQFVVTKGYNIWEVTERLFSVRGHHNSLWPETTTFERPQRDYLRMEGVTICCGGRPH